MVIRVVVELPLNAPSLNFRSIYWHSHCLPLVNLHFRVDTPFFCQLGLFFIHYRGRKPPSRPQWGVLH